MFAVVVDKAGDPGSGGGAMKADGDGTDDWLISDMIQDYRMGCLDHDWDLTTDWKTLSEPALYYDDYGVELVLELYQGTWLDRRSLEEGGIVD